MLKDVAPKVYETYQMDVLSKMVSEDEKGNYATEPVYSLRHDPRSEYDIDYTIEFGEESKAEKAESPAEEAPVEEIKEETVTEESTEEPVEEKCDGKDEEDEEEEEYKETEEVTLEISKIEAPKLKTIKVAENIRVKVKDKPVTSIKDKQLREREELEKRQAQERIEAEIKNLNDYIANILDSVNEAIAKQNTLFAEKIKETYENIEIVNDTVSKLSESIDKITTAFNKSLDNMKALEENHKLFVTEKQFLKSLNEVKEGFKEIDSVKTMLSEAKEEIKAFKESYEKDKENIAEVGLVTDTANSVNNLEKTVELLKESYNGLEEQFVKKEDLPEQITVEQIQEIINEKIKEQEPAEEEEIITETAPPTDEKYEAILTELENLKTHIKPTYQGPEESIKETSSAKVVDLEVDHAKG